MNTAVAITALAVALAGTPSSAPLSPANSTTTVHDDTPPGPEILAVDHGEQLSDGRRIRWVAVTYELSAGQAAETFVEVDELGISEALISMDGEPILYVAVDGLGNQTTWFAPGVSLPPETLAGLVHVTVADAVFKGIAVEPVGFPCSEWGKHVVQGSKYVWKAVVFLGGTACCAATSGAGCLLCGLGGEVFEEVGEGALDDYCE
jgi:hypothetical protein